MNTSNAEIPAIARATVLNIAPVETPDPSGNRDAIDPGTLDEAIAPWNAKLKQSLGFSTGWLISVGIHLRSAKKELGRSKWKRIFALGHLPFGRRMAEIMMRIAGNPALRNNINLMSLPRSVMALNYLAGLDANIVEQGILAGNVHMEMTAREAKAFAQRYHGLPVTGAVESPRS